MPSTRTNLFIDAIQQSGLLERAEIDEFLWENDLGEQRTGKIARVMVQQNKLTLFQARQLLQGRWRNLVIGNYRILHLLSQGGIGRVFLAQEKRSRHRCVIKVLRERQRGRAESVERFRLEAFACMELKHPNLVRGHEYSAIDDNAQPVHYLAMDLVKGPNLHEMYAMKGRFSWPQACEVIRQIAVALEDVHQANFVHRDIKPPNVLLDPDGTAKLIDFGLAWYSGSDHDFHIPTDRRVGTTGFIAPEQYVRGRDVDCRADIYGLGCTLYFALTSRLPKLNRDKDSKARGSLDLSMLDSVRPELPTELKSVVRRMVARRVADRYPNAAEVVAALKPFVEPFEMTIPFNSLLKARDRARSERVAPIKPEAEVSTARVSPVDMITKRDTTVAVPLRTGVSEASGDIGVSAFDDRPDMVAKVEELTRRLHDAQQQVLQMRQELLQVQSSLATSETAWADEIAEVREELEESNRERDALAAELASAARPRNDVSTSAAAELHQPRSELATAWQQVVDGQRMLESRERAHAEEVDALKAELSRLQRDVRHVSRDAALPTSAAEQASQLPSEAEQQQQASHVDDLVTLQKEAESLAARLNNQLVEQVDFVLQLQQKNDASKHQVDQLRSYIAALRKEVARSHEQTTALADEFRRTSQLRADGEGDFSATCELLLRREAELSTALQNVELLTNEVHASRERTESYLTAIQGERDSLANDMTWVQAQDPASYGYLAASDRAVSDSVAVATTADLEQLATRGELGEHRAKISAVVQEIAALSEKARCLANTMRESAESSETSRSDQTHGA